MMEIYRNLSTMDFASLILVFVTLFETSNAGKYFRIRYLSTIYCLKCNGTTIYILLILRQTLLSLGCTKIDFEDSTHTGDGVYDGMDPSGIYSDSPDPFTVTTALTIESDINKEYDCSDHFFVITSTSSFGTWTWSSQNDRIKIVWNCKNLYIYHPTSSTSSSSESLGIHHLVITYTPTTIRVVTDTDSVDLSVAGTYWEEVWLWIGADDDKEHGSDFSNTLVNTSVVYTCSGIFLDIENGF